MKKLNLTEEHKSKLLEICKKLFPEYDKLSINEYQIDVYESITLIALFKENKDFDINNGFSFPYMGNHFHWFEFCMTKIVPKLLNSIGDISDLCTGENGLRHPVDYLYSEFLKSK